MGVRINNLDLDEVSKEGVKNWLERWVKIRVSFAKIGLWD